jgi:hypothetical protein
MDLEVALLAKQTESVAHLPGDAKTGVGRSHLGAGTRRRQPSGSDGESACNDRQGSGVGEVGEAAGHHHDLTNAARKAKI